MQFPNTNNSNRRFKRRTKLEEMLIQEFKEENSDNDIEDQTIENRIKMAKDFRNSQRKKKKSLFSNIDIDESTAIDNRDLYNFEINEKDLEVNNGSNYFNKKTILKKQINQNNKTPQKQENIEINSFKKAKEKTNEIINKICVNRIKASDEKNKIKKEIEKIKSEELQLEKSEKSLEKKYEFIQNISHLLITICYCLTDKLPKIDKCANKLTEIKKIRKTKLDNYYFNGKNNLIEINKEFNEKCNKIQKFANQIMKNVDLEYCDVQRLLNQFIDIKKNFKSLYNQKFFNQSIPSLIVPLIGHSLIINYKTDKIEEIKRFLMILSVLEKNSGENTKKPENGINKNYVNDRMTEKIWNVVLMPFVKELIELQWDLFSVSEFEEIIEWFESLSKIAMKYSFKFEPIIISILERFSSQFSKINQFIRKENINFDETLLRYLFKNYRSFFEQLKKDSFCNNSKLKKIIEIYASNELIGSSVGETTQNLEETLIDKSLSLKNILKNIKSI